MKNKLLSIILAVAILASLCSMMIVPVSAATASSLSTDSDGAYLIQSAKDMDTFQTEVKSGVFENADVVVKLTTDITLNTTYTYNGEKHGFWGTFDGQGHTIDGLTVSGKFAGLFGTPLPTTATTITIKNVAFTNSRSESANAGDYSGLLFGQIQNTVTLNLNNIYVDTTMYTTFKYSGTKLLLNHGGLMGLAGLVTNIENSVINVTTDVTEDSVFFASGIIAGRALAGYEFNISNSALYGDVKIGKGYTYGLWGINSGGKTELSATDHTGEYNNSIVDLTFNSTTDSAKEREIVGKLNTFTFFEGETAVAADIYGLDAVAVDGFTKTVGHLVPTSLLKMFPEHCLDEADVTGGILEFEGYQTNNDNKMRLVATIADKDIKNYNSVGFEVVAVYGENVKSTSFTSKTVYTSIGANTATGDTTISAESLIGADGYIFAMIIGNLPADTPVTLQVKTFYTDINDTQTDGSTTVFTVSQMPSGTVSGGK